MFTHAPGPMAGGVVIHASLPYLACKRTGSLSSSRNRKAASRFGRPSVDQWHGANEPASADARRATSPRGDVTTSQTRGTEMTRSHPVNSGRRAMMAAVAFVSGAAAVLGAVMVFRAIEGIDNSAAAYAQHGRTFWTLALASTAVGIGVAVLFWKCEARALRRAARFTAWMLGANLVLWMAPVPFGLHRFLTMGLVMVGAGLLLVASLMPVWAALRAAGREHASGWGWGAWWRAPVAGLGALSAASAGMLMFKVGQMGWAAAVD